MNSKPATSGDAALEAISTPFAEMEPSTSQAFGATGVPEVGSVAFGVWTGGSNRCPPSPRAEPPNTANQVTEIIAGRVNFRIRT
jgi:hypothetical protein